jgi:hypothetical protein
MMGRIRSIKPEFCQSESIGRLSRDARLLYIQLWTVVDDHGRARAALRLLASLLYPYDEDAAGLIGRWLDELEEHGLIRRYVVERCDYLDIPTWGKHQRLDNAAKPQLPEYSPDTRREPPRAAATDGGSPLFLRRGEERRGEEISSSLRSEEIVGHASARPTLSGKQATKKPKPNGTYSSEFQERFWEPYPRTRIMSKAEAWRAWQRLSPDDRAAACDALPEFKAFLKSKPDHPAVHACRFLSQRRFEGFAAGSDGASDEGALARLEEHRRACLQRDNGG